MPDSSNNPTHDEISALAQQFYDEEGRPEGKADEHWVRAQEQIRQRHVSGSVQGETQPQSTADTAADSGEELS